MFILCPHCQFLVAIDAASGLPPVRCPRCGQALRAEAVESAAEAGAVSQAAEPAAPAVTAVPEPADAAAVEADAPTRVPMTASADADGATALAPAAPRPDTDGPASAPTAAAPAQTEHLAKPAKAPKPEKAAKLEAAKPGKPHKPEKPGKSGSAAKPGKPGKPDKAAKTGKPAKPKAPVPAQAPQDNAPAPRRVAAPSFARTTARAPATRRGTTVAAIAGLALLLALQLLLADRVRLAADARWRPALAALCGTLRCTLPPWHEPDAFALVARDVRPTRRGVLRVSATFRNDARWTQAWPALHLALQDVDGRTVGARVFAPPEYLRGRDTRNGLAPGQVAGVDFDIDEPGGTVVAFTFDFR